MATIVVDAPTEATVVSVGETGPPGAQGLTGSVGPIGAIGPSGFDGEEGADGATGPQGAQGETGPQGTVGPQGAAGPVGPPGSDGEDGADGSPGPAGQTGAVGATGAPGADGAPGATGAAGATGAQGLQGVAGPQGPPGLDGEDGLDGLVGPQGVTGATGATGATGSVGATGATGAQGPQGVIGPSGPPGLDGVDGADGEGGLPGPQGATGPSLTAGGRLTLTTSTPVTTADVTAATTVFYAPYINDLIPIYGGAVWASYSFAEISLALDSDSGHTGYHQSGKNFDLFVVNDLGTRRLGTGPAWTSDTARGTGAGTTELERKNGLWTNKVSMTLRFGSSSGNTITVSANRGTYVGTMRAPANGQCEDSFSKRFLWNTYNRVLRIISIFETADSWTYSTAAYRQMNANAANQLAMVRGLDEDAVKALARQSAANSTSTLVYPAAAIGLDSTTTPAADCFPCQLACSLSFTAEFHIPYAGWPGLGYHFLAFLEQGAGTDTQTWYGDAGAPSVFQTGGYAQCLA